MIDAIREHLNARWAALRPGAPPLAGAIVAAADREMSAKASFIFFDSAGEPAAVAKVARSFAGEQALRAEDAALRYFRSLGCGTVRDNAPEPILLKPIGGRLVFGMTAVQGRPMLTRYHTPGHTRDPNRVAGDFAAAGAWLERFHRETLSDVELFDARTFQRRIGTIFDRYRREVGWSQAEEQLFDAVAERARRLRGSLIPITGVHGDYWVGNILVDGDVVRGVIDWERSVPSGPPLADLYKFATSYGFYLDRTTAGSEGPVPGHPGRTEHLTRWRRFGTWRNLAGFGYTYFGHGWFPERVRGFVLDHLAALGIPAAANGVFFPAFLAEQATALDVPEFREGYRSLLLAFAAERSSTWLWTNNRSSIRGTRGVVHVG